MNRIKPFWIGMFVFTLLNLGIALTSLGTATNGFQFFPPTIAPNSTLPAGFPTLTPQPTATSIPMVPVVIAIQEIPRGTVISPDRVAVIIFPADTAPRGAFTSISDVVGYIAATDIVIEEIILARKLVIDPNAVSARGSDLAAILAPNRVGITLYLPLAEIPQGLANGDRIDIVMTFPFIRLDAGFQSAAPNDLTVLGENAEGETQVVAEGSGRLELIPPVGEVISQPSEGQHPRIAAQRSILDAQVMWIGAFPANGNVFSLPPTPTYVMTPTPFRSNDNNRDFGTAAPSPTSFPVGNVIIPITLGVSAQDAVAIVWARRANIPMTLILRSARAQGLGETEPVTLDWVMQAYNVSLPAENEFGVDTVEATQAP